MTFLWLFWPAYVPVVVLMMAAVSEWTTAPRGTRVPHASPAKRKHACAGAVVPFPTNLRSLGSQRRDATPMAATTGHVIKLHEARLRRSHSIC